jgi:hypothetical protein
VAADQHRPIGGGLLARSRENDFDTLRSWFLLVLLWRQYFDPCPTPFVVALRRRPIPLQTFGHHYSKLLNAQHGSITYSRWFEY